MTKALLYNIYNRSYILYKGVFLFFFFLFFRGKKTLIYIHICVREYKKKKKNEKVSSQCSQTAFFSREMIKNRIFIFFLMAEKRFFIFEGTPTPENEGRQARARTHKAAILAFCCVIFVAMINYMPVTRKRNRREIGAKIRGAQNLHICTKSSTFAAEF